MLSTWVEFIFESGWDTSSIGFFASKYGSNLWFGWWKNEKKRNVTGFHDKTYGVYKHKSDIISRRLLNLSLCWMESRKLNLTKEATYVTCKLLNNKKLKTQKLFQMQNMGFECIFGWITCFFKCISSF